MGIDIIVCAKNREKPMANVLRQIVNEIPVEKLIVIYGTSYDRTREVALQYTENVYWDRDEGLGAARNLGIMKSSTDIVGMIDTDIILPKDWYQKLIRHFSDSRVAAAIGTCIYGYGCPPLQKYFEQRSKVWEIAWGTHTILLKRDAVLKIGNFSKEVKGAGEDYELYRRICGAGFRWVWDKEVVVHHPMNMLEFLQHSIWWAKGLTSLIEEEPYSLSQFLIRLAFIARNGIVYRKIHPTLSLYIPFIELINLMIDIKARYSRQRSLGAREYST